MPAPKLPLEYTRTSIYRREDGVKIGEAKYTKGAIKWDVRTCHYPDYYFENAAPSDNQLLKINYFLVFDSGAEFEITNSSEPVNPELHVLGGMGSVGYGEFI